MKKQMIWMTTLTMVCLVAACGEVDRLHDMQDTTNQMNKTTKDMNQTTHQMNDTTGQMAFQMADMDKNMNGLSTDTGSMKTTTQAMATEMANMADTFRQGGSAELRIRLLEQLAAKRDIGSKIAMASIYFLSYEFQLYSGTGEDNSDAKMQSLKYDAVHEFFGDVREFIDPANGPKPLAQVGEGSGIQSKENREASLNALSAAMAWNNRKQGEAKTHGVIKKQVSMYSLIANALIRGEDLKNGRVTADQLTPAEKEVLANKPLALRVLQNRLNFMPMLIMAELMPYSDIRSVTGTSADGAPQTLLEQFKAEAKAGLMKLTGFSASWTVNVDALNQPALERLNGYEKEYEDTRTLMVIMKQPVTIDKHVRAFANGLKLVATYRVSALENQTRGSFVKSLYQMKKNLN